MDGDEIVQVYVRTPESPKSWERPIKRLKGFKRVTIPRGQVKTVSIDIDCSDLWFWDAENDKITFDPGKYVFEVGASSRDIRGQVEATMSGKYKPVLSTVVAEGNQAILRPGNTIETSVTASMSDDSFYDLTKAKVVYKCNNPSVATVDAAGKVTAVGVGVATIFADVTVDGTTVSGSYPIKVMPDLSPKSILVNKRVVSGFDKETKAYSYLLDNKSKTPVVEATAIDPGVKVEFNRQIRCRGRR